VAIPEAGRGGVAPSVPSAGTSFRSLESTCRICGDVQHNRTLTLKEMMFGSREEFNYVECATCGTVQIVEIPSDLGKYYPSAGYYSLVLPSGRRASPLHEFLEALEFRAIARPSLGHGSEWYQRLSALDLTEPGVEAVGKANVARDARVLEVGCGNGRLLRILARLGFTNLRGIDPFLPGDAIAGGIPLEKRELDDLDRSAFFDLVILYHSLEHVPDPIATLRSVREHLTGDGVAVVAMPIVNAAFREYGTSWYQLDPPRHLHLFSARSFEIALARSGLRLSGSYFNSTAAQFRLSEAYARNVALAEIPSPMLSFGRARLPELLTRREARYRARAHALNATEEGDQAVFYLRRKAEAMRAG